MNDEKWLLLKGKVRQWQLKNAEAVTIADEKGNCEEFRLNHGVINTTCCDTSKKILVKCGQYLNYNEIINSLPHL